MNNFMELKVYAVPENESFTRNSVAAFCASVNPSAEIIGDIKMAVSEAVSNCIVHAYKNLGGTIILRAEIVDCGLHIEISDNGGGISDIKKACELYFTTAGDGNRAGIGFTIMKAFMDKFDVQNNDIGGLTVFMDKKLA